MWLLTSIINLLILPLLGTVGFLANRVRYGWLIAPMAVLAAPLFFTLIGTFDDGEGVLWRLAVGLAFGVPIALGWLGAELVSKRGRAARPG